MTLENKPEREYPRDKGRGKSVEPDVETILGEKGDGIKIKSRTNKGFSIHFSEIKIKTKAMTAIWVLGS